MQTILAWLKSQLGVSEDDTSFDSEILSDANLTFSSLSQMGIKDQNGNSFIITADTTFDEMDLFFKDLPDYELYRKPLINTYVYLDVKIVFDPPASSTILQAYNDKKKEVEWRLLINEELK